MCRSVTYDYNSSKIVLRSNLCKFGLKYIGLYYCLRIVRRMGLICLNNWCARQTIIRGLSKGEIIGFNDTYLQS